MRETREGSAQGWLVGRGPRWGSELSQPRFPPHYSGASGRHCPSPKAVQLGEQPSRVPRLRTEGEAQCRGRVAPAGQSLAVGGGKAGPGPSVPAPGLTPRSPGSLTAVLSARPGRQTHALSLFPFLASQSKTVCLFSCYKKSRLPPFVPSLPLPGTW